MRTAEPMLFGDALSEVGDTLRVGDRAGVTKGLMTRLAEKGVTLEQCCDPKMMKRSLGTLRKRAREYGIAFPDYVPMALRKRVTFQRMGDFYECFGADAELVAPILGIVLMQRGKGADARPMCGIPAHAARDCRAKLQAAWIVVKGLPK